MAAAVPAKQHAEKQQVVNSTPSSGWGAGGADMAPPAVMSVGQPVLHVQQLVFACPATFCMICCLLFCRGDQHQGGVVQYCVPGSVRWLSLLPTAVPEEVLPEKEAAVRRAAAGVCSTFC
jgi:hypothetical protein